MEWWVLRAGRVQSLIVYLPLWGQRTIFRPDYPRIQIFPDLYFNYYEQWLRFLNGLVWLYLWTVHVPLLKLYKQVNKLEIFSHLYKTGHCSRTYILFCKKMSSDFRPHPHFEGPIKACVFDWAGNNRSIFNKTRIFG